MAERMPLGTKSKNSPDGRRKGKTQGQVKVDHDVAVADGGSKPKCKVKEKINQGKFKTTETGAESDNKAACVICCEEIEFFAVGPCDHTDGSVCYKCSSRMRVLCEQNYCAVCRADIKEVVFCRKPLPFKNVFQKSLPCVKEFKIYFEDHKLRSKFIDLLLHVCPICERLLHSFDQMRIHVRREHDKQYCGICTLHLKLFPREFSVYSRSQIVVHRKEGDVHNRSYRGHPLCEFCSDRYFDNDELLVHLRKNHFWCHFCENDGRQDYFADYNDLQEHFRRDHFLCEEGNCMHEKYTSVFRNQLDLQAHKIGKHNKQLSRQEAKQARSITVDIDYGSRRPKRPGMVSSRDYDEVNGKERKRYSERRNELRRSPDLGLDTALATSLSLQTHPHPDIPPQSQPKADTRRKGNATEKQEKYDEDKGIDKTKVCLDKTKRVRKSELVNQNENTNQRKENIPAVGTHEEFPNLSTSPAVSTAAQQSSTAAQQSSAAGQQSSTAGQQSSTAGQQSSTAGQQSSTAGQQSSTVAPIVDKYADSVRQGELLKKTESKKETMSWANASGSSVDITCQENFPALGIKHGGNLRPNNGPPGLNNVIKSNPSNPNKINPNKTKLPPGFGSVVTKSKVPPGLRSHQAWSVKQPAQDNRKGKFELERNPSPDLSLQERNLNLITLINSLLSEEDFDRFKYISGKYRHSQMTVASYYDNIHSLLGGNFQKVFKELVDLLPDVEKQKQLLQVHDEKIKEKQKEAKEVSAPKDVAAPKEVPTPKEIVEHHPKEPFPKEPSPKEPPRSKNKKKGGMTCLQKQAMNRLDSHSDTDFPALPIAALPKSNFGNTKPIAPSRSVWVKGK